MPLTATEEQEFQTLLAEEQQLSQQQGLSDEEEQEFQALESEENVLGQEREEELFDILARRGPKRPVRIPSPGEFGEIAGPSIGLERGRLQTQQQEQEEARRELVGLGKTPEQIDFVLNVGKKVDAPRTGKAIGGIVGAIAAPLAIGQLIPGPIDEAITIPLAIAKAVRGVSPIVGAGLFGTAGEAAQVGLEEKRIAGTSELLKAFGTEAAFEAGGGAVTRAFKLAFSPAVKRVIPESARLADDFVKFGGVFPPTTLDKRLSLSIAEEIARGSFGAREVFEELTAKNLSAGLVYADSFLDEMAAGFARIGPTELGKEFAEGITKPRGRVFKILDDLFDPLYKHLDDLTAVKTTRQFGDVTVPSTILDETGKPLTRQARRVVGEATTGRLSPGFKELEQFVEPVTVSTRPLKRFVIKQLKENRALLKRGKKGAVLLTEEAEREFNKFLNLKDDFTFGQMRKFRSKILRDVRKLHRDVGQDEALVKQIEQLTFNALTDPASVKNAPKEVQLLHRNLANLYRVSREGLEETFSEKLAERLSKNPTNVVKELFPQKNPTAIKALRESLIEPISGKRSKEGTRLWNQLRTAFFADALEKSTKETAEGSIVLPNTFEGIIRKMGKEAIDEMLPDATGKRQLRNMRDLMQALGRKKTGGASLFVRGGQVGGLVLLYNGVREGDFLQAAAGGALVMGPRSFAKLAAHPLGSKLITSGIKLKPGSTTLAATTARIVNLLNTIDRQEAQQKAARRKQIKFQRATKITEEQIRTGQFQPTPTRQQQQRQFPAFR